MKCRKGKGRNGDPRVEGAGLKITGSRRHQHPGALSQPTSKDVLRRWWGKLASGYCGSRPCAARLS
jgi:hypothetical protein